MTKYREAANKYFQKIN